MAYHQYLTPSRGVWYFQRWASINIHGATAPALINYRKSLRTKDIRTAKQRARILAVKLDELIKQHFASASEFSRAMESYHKVVVQNPSLEQYEEMGWSDPDELRFSAEDMLLTKASQFSKHVDQNIQELQNRIQNLETLLEKSQAITDQFDLRTELANLSLETADDRGNPTLDSLFDEYKSWASNQKQMVALDSIYIPAIELFLKFLQFACAKSELRTQDVTSDLAKQYVKFYASIPKRSRIKNASIENLMGLVGETKAKKTIEDHVTVIHGFLSFASKNGYRVDQQMLAVLGYQPTLYGRISKATPRTAFSDEQLATVFNSRHYVQGDIKFSGMYWAPLIAMFSGARLAEILQLTQDDIKKKDGIWTLEITGEASDADRKKRVKTTASNRLIPIHRKLIELDLIQYVDAQDGRLFPDEERDRQGKFSNFSKRFRTYRQQIGLYSHDDEIRRDFHSFRHTVETKLKEMVGIGSASKRVDTYTIDSIMGHVPSTNAVGEKVYNHSLNLLAKKNAIQQLEYPTVKFEEIKHWKRCKFTRVNLRIKTSRNKIS